MLGSCVGDRETRADGQRRELIDSVAARAPVRKLLFVEALGHTRMPFAAYRPDHRDRVELAAIDAHRAAEAAADIERRLDDGVAREARQDRFAKTTKAPSPLVFLKRLKGLASGNIIAVFLPYAPSFPR